MPGDRYHPAASPLDRRQAAANGARNGPNKVLTPPAQQAVGLFAVDGKTRDQGFRMLMIDRLGRPLLAAVAVVCAGLVAAMVLASPAHAARLEPSCSLAAMRPRRLSRMRITSGSFTRRLVAVVGVVCASLIGTAAFAPPAASVFMWSRTAGPSTCLRTTMSVGSVMPFLPHHRRGDRQQM
jgi:hypothetical protein